jgi:hypothetical protein
MPASSAQCKTVVIEPQPTWH